MEEKNFTTVQTAHDEDIILIGEEHGNQHSGDLASRVLDQVNPAVLAIEESPGSFLPGSAAMGRVSNHAEMNSIPLVRIDKADKRDRFREVEGRVSTLISEANKFSHPIQENGDLNPEAIDDARNRIREEFGEKGHRIMYDEREEVMAEMLVTAKEQFGAPVVSAIGTFHIMALKDMIEEVQDPGELKASRIHRWDDGEAVVA